MLYSHPLPEWPDSELIRSYKESGNMELLGALYTRYTSLVYGVCLKYLKNRDDAKDAVMQLFEKLAVNLLNHEVTHFKSWLYVSVRNHCLMQLRSQKSKHVEEISPFLMETGADPHLETGDELEGNLVKLEKCIEKLGFEQQQCVRLFFLQEKCYADICILTGFAMSQVKSHIQNGKRNLKICMEQHD